MPKDNQTLRQKVSLRLRLLNALGEPPRILETHGGWGGVYLQCYHHIPDGVVFEKDEQKSAALAYQRPSWCVLQADCVAAIAGGIGLHHQPNFFDLDPSGEPWNILDALFFQHPLWSVGRVVFAVNDGLRQKLRLKTGWSVHALAEAVEVFGNEALHDRYLDVCRWLIERKTSQIGYRLARFGGYYCGQGSRMTHYGFILEQA